MGEALFMNEFWTQFFNQYESNQQALEVLTGHSKMYGLMLSGGLFLPFLGIIIGAVDAYFKDPKFITKQYVLFVLAMTSITFVIGNVFVGKDFNGYAKSEIHYIEMSDNNISKLEEYQRLSDVEKKAVLMAFDFSKEKMPTSSKPLMSINDNSIYDLNKLKELSLMNEESLTKLMNFKKEQQQGIKRLNIDNSGLENVLLSFERWMVKKIS